MCNYNDGGAYFQSHKLLLFNSKRHKVGSVLITTAIAKDVDKCTSTMPIAIRKVGHIYVPEDKYISTDPLPDVWMEIFDSKYVGNDGQDEIMDTSEELDEAYDPEISLDHMKARAFGTSRVMHLKVSLDNDNKFDKRQ
jgi:hypothetical protein